MQSIKRLIENWGKFLLIGLGILFVAILLRSANLNSIPVFGDEAIYIRWSQVMNAEPGLRFLPLSDGKQPMFMWVLMFLVNRFSDPVIIGRLTSVFYGIGTLVGIFMLTVVLFSRFDKADKGSGGDRGVKIGLIASFFWAVSPYSVFYDRLALVDSMLAMFGVWTLLFAVASVKYIRLDAALLSGFALGGALLTKSPGIFFVLMLPLTWFVSSWPKRNRETTVGINELVHLIKLAFLSLSTIIVGAVMYNILRLGENFHLVSSRNNDYVFPISHVWTEPFSPLVSNLSSIFDWIWMLGPSLIIIFLLLFIIKQMRELNVFNRNARLKSEVALLFVWTFLPILVSAIYGRAITPRYILFTLPTMFIFTSLVFENVFSKRGIISKLLIFGLAVYALQAVYINYLLIASPESAPLPRIVRSGYLEEWTSGYGIKKVSEIILEQYKSEPDKKIVVGTEGYFGTLPDALQAYLNKYPEITVIGVGIDLKDVPLSLKESKDAGNKTYLVINSTRLLADPDKLGLELLAAYPKAFRQEGSREYNLYGSRETLYLFEVMGAVINEELNK